MKNGWLHSAIRRRSTGSGTRTARLSIWVFGPALSIDSGSVALLSRSPECFRWPQDVPQEHGSPQRPAAPQQAPDLAPPCPVGALPRCRGFGRLSRPFAPGWLRLRLRPDQSGRPGGGPLNRPERLCFVTRTVQDSILPPAGDGSSYSVASSSARDCRIFVSACTFSMR